MATLSGSHPAFATTTNTKPNIIFILVDDMGYGDVGVLYQNLRAAGNKRNLPAESTPNLDAFANEGAQLLHHYCPAPVCAPSRASLLMGVTQGHANVRDNQFDKALENNHTLATVLKQAGYETAIIGKWGLQGHGAGQQTPATWPAYPTKRGFDYFYGYVRHRDGHEHYPKEGLYDGPKEVWENTREVSAGLDKCYTTDLWTARAKAWIANHAQTNSKQPFFLYLAYDTPHAAQEYPPTAYPAGGGLTGGLQWTGKPHEMINTAMGKIDTYIDPVYASATWDNDNNPATPEVPWPDVDKRYGTSVRRIDQAVGDLVHLLKDLNIETNTLVVFASDNGPSNESYIPNEPLTPQFFGSYAMFDGIKRDCWEGGLRVPGLVRWPGHIPAGEKITRPSALYDWLPTFAEVSGVPIPARADGVSLLPELTGAKNQSDRGYLYFEYFFDGKTPKYREFAASHRGRTRGQMQMIRMGDYVGVRYNIQTQADPFEIYQIVTDPEETNNLATLMPELEKAMHEKVLQVRRPDESAKRPYDDELVPSVVVSNTVAGVNWAMFDGHFPWLPDFGEVSAHPMAHGVVPNFQTAVARFGMMPNLFYTGYLKIPKDGDYSFHIKTDGRALLRIHDATVIDADFGNQAGKDVSGTIKLQAGLHPFKLDYMVGNKNQSTPKITWSGPGFAEQPIGDAFVMREQQ